MPRLEKNIVGFVNVKQGVYLLSSKKSIAASFNTAASLLTPQCQSESNKCYSIIRKPDFFLNQNGPNFI
jgi:hypothetical protein